MEKKKNWILRIVFPVLCSCIILISCVIPAKATDTSVDSLISGCQTITTSSVTAKFRYKSSSDWFYNVHPLANFIDTTSSQQSFVSMYGGFGFMNSDYASLKTTTSISPYTDSNYGTFNRVGNMVVYFTDDDMDNENEYLFGGATVNTDAWSYPAFNDKFKAVLEGGFVVTGSGTFDVDIGIRYVDNAGIVRYITYQRNDVEVGEFNAPLITPLYGRKALLTRTDTNAILRSMLDYNGGYILIDHITVDYTPFYDDYKDPQFGFDIIADDITLIESYPSSQYRWSRFYAENNIQFSDQYVPGMGGGITDPSEIETVWQGFFSGVVGGFLDAPLFGEISIGQIMFIVIGVCIAIWLLKVFAGG